MTMLKAIPKNNIPVYSIESAIHSLKQLITHRIKSYFNDTEFNLHEWQNENADDTLFRQGIQEQFPNIQNTEEWIILMLALTPHITPGFFESIIVENLQGGGDFPEFGGVKGTSHRSMLPTGETAQFILAGNNIEERLKISHYFSQEHFFGNNNLLWLESVREGEPVMSGRIILSEDYIDKILYNKESAPRFGIDFPAKKITTSMNWSDLVLSDYTGAQVADIKTWMEHNPRLLDDENLKRKIKPGYRVLFYGPPGTGKTLTATLIGKEYGKEVYRIDLSQVVSKFIGETEKNLERVFEKAAHKNWILFFDEADALFGKRTNVQSAHDKYANQEIAYLLQRVEDYNGLIILASNFKNNIDDAFLRRFHSIVHFPLPDQHDRAILWQKSLPLFPAPSPEIDFDNLSRQYELTGADILNIIHYAALRALQNKNKQISKKDLLEGIRREFRKQDKTMAV